MFDAKRAVRLQRELFKKAIDSLNNPPPLSRSEIKYVAGVDAAFHHNKIVGVATAIEYGTGTLVEYSVVEKNVHVPYIPGLLAFREAPAYISAIKKLSIEPDIVMVDGHGLTHPRGLGIATHIGLVLGKPSIGVAKKKLYGEEIVEDNETYIYAHGVKAGKIIIHNNKRLYISIGYMIKLEDAINITRHLLRPGSKLPLPTETADRISKRIAKRKRSRAK